MSFYSTWLNRWILIFLCQAFCTVAAADSTLARGVYKGNISGWKADMVRTLTQTSADRYQLTSEAKNLFAVVREISEFEFSNEQVRPIAYVYERKLFGRHTVEKITFDWAAGKAHYTRSDRPQNNTTHTLEPGVFDPALYQLVMQADLAHNDGPKSYKFVKRKRIETYEFKHLPNEPLEVGKKSHEARVVVREDQPDDKTTKIWVIPELDYQVGQIRHTDDGDTYQIRLAEYRADTAKLKQLYARISNKAASTQPR